MPRPSKRPLSGADRRKFAVGCLRRFREGDDVAKLSLRIGQPPRRILEALDEPLSRVRSLMGRGVTALDIADESALPIPFVKYAMRRAFAQPKRESARVRLDDARNNRRRRTAQRSTRSSSPREEPAAHIDLAALDEDMMKLLRFASDEG